MAMKYSQALQDARMDKIIELVDAHASPAFMEIYTSGYGTLICTITLSDPSFVRSGATPSTKIAMQGLPKTSSANSTGSTQTAAIARIKTGGGVIVIQDLSITVTGGGGDIQLNTVTVLNGQTVTLQTTADIYHYG